MDLKKGVAHPLHKEKLSKCPEHILFHFACTDSTMFIYFIDISSPNENMGISFLYSALIRMLP